MSEKQPSNARDFTIWWFAFGYFASYVPYSALTKALSKGLLPSMEGEGIPGVSLLPLSVSASVVGMFTFLTLMKWWRFASHRTIAGRSVPFPGLWTTLSGLCTATIVATTTLAYTFDGVSIVFVMLLMRGGVLIIAPVIDALTGRHVRWFSWAGLALSMGALLVAFSEEGGYALTFLCGLDIFLYLASYFIRLRFMSRLAKSSDQDVTKRYFVEEQMVATPVVFALLVIGALVGRGEALEAIRFGFVDIWEYSQWPWVILIGFFSQGTGIFGGLILLDRRENTFCVPVNRSSSILAGVIASLSLALILGQRAPSAYQLTGAAMIIGAILFLTVPALVEKRRNSAA
jgi:drug/metabolite transporter (DMT)-like permease